MWSMEASGKKPRSLLHSFIRKYGPAVFTWIVLFGMTAVFYITVAPSIIKEFKAMAACVVAVDMLLDISVTANYFMAISMDPGSIPVATASEEQQLNQTRAPWYKNVDIRRIGVRAKWCTTCHFYRPPRCSHCSQCNHCIETFDHHCPWLDNCVGRRNYRPFFLFLVLSCVHVLTVFGLCMAFTWRMRSNLLAPANLASLLVMTLTLALASPVFALTVFHTFLVVKGRTTNEQLTGKFRRGYNPFDQGVMRNLVVLCISSRFPKYAEHVQVSKAAASGSSASSMSIRTHKTIWSNKSNVSEMETMKESKRSEKLKIESETPGQP